jgi:hypothetical protein
MAIIEAVIEAPRVKKHPRGRPFKKHPAADRFWAKVRFSPDPNGCWIWTGCQAGKGYGTFGVTHSCMTYSHRWSYERAHGPIPEGHEIRHACPGGPNTLCVRPSHLTTGTHADNVKDMTSAGRQARGEKHGSAKLTSVDIEDIFRLWATGRYTKTAIGKAKEVSQSHITRILARQKWAGFVPGKG